jgi:signal transduction histidine kinase
VEGLGRIQELPNAHRRRVALALGQIDYLEDLTDRMQVLWSGHVPGVGADPADLAEVAHSVAAETAELNPGVSVSFVGEEALPRVTAGRGAIRGVAVNLCRNAVQAMEGRGGLFLWTRRHSEGFVELGVRDTGPGIPPSELDRVWQPFYTTRRGGLGLGLALVKSVAESHGGGAELESRPGAGTTVRVWFPTPSREASLVSRPGD